MAKLINHSGTCRWKKGSEFSDFTGARGSEALAAKVVVELGSNSSSSSSDHSGGGDGDNISSGDSSRGEIVGRDESQGSLAQQAHVQQGPSATQGVTTDAYSEGLRTLLREELVPKLRQEGLMCRDPWEGKSLALFAQSLVGGVWVGVRAVTEGQRRVESLLQWLQCLQCLLWLQCMSPWQRPSTMLAGAQAVAGGLDVPGLGGGQEPGPVYSISGELVNMVVTWCARLDESETGGKVRLGQGRRLGGQVPGPVSFISGRLNPGCRLEEYCIREWRSIRVGEE